MPGITIQSPQQTDTAAIAEAAFVNVPSLLPESSYVCVGDTIDTGQQEGFLRGHGTQVVDGNLLATVCGVIQRVNKLISVVPVKARYNPELGDVVVGRVTEVANKRWRIDLKSRQAAALMLSAVNLPGGVQRRRTAEDELNMREVYTEGDLISAEVQSFYADGAIALHTRSLKYGKLANGQIVEVPPNLIKRQKQHFTTLEGTGVQLILGLNGVIWVSAESKQPPEQANSPLVSEAQPVLVRDVSKAECHAIARVANCIRALATLYFSIHPASIISVYTASLDQNVAVTAITQEAMLSDIASKEAAQREGDD
ncbi:hypothetical protein ABBQ32_003010 [Trebouxia sp. C0010 RCD-2024]